MSKPAWAAFITSIVFTGSVISYVQYKQNYDKKMMRRGIELEREKKERWLRNEQEYNRQRTIEESMLHTANSEINTSSINPT